ncbi:unnamed protein product, partial [Symbiodinium sp. CCMP2456]
VPDALQRTRGYRLLLRTDEVWKDNITHKLSESWAVEYNKHLIRPKFYKGTRLEAEAETSSIKLSYNGMSFPGFFFTAASILQIRSCRPEHQKACLKALEMFVASFCPPNMQIFLLPGVQASVIQFHGHDVDLEQWSRLLEFFGWKERWQKCKLLSLAVQRLNAGVKGALAAWFVLRIPFQDLACQGRVEAGRLQKRLIHSLSQAAELHTSETKLTSLPCPEKSDEFHPMKRILGSH